MNMNEISPRQNHAGEVPLSVIMPAYNEEGSIRDAVADVEQHILNQVPDAILVVVDDGSRDKTGTLLDELAARNSRLRVIHQQNGGHAAALMTGLSNSTGEYIMLLDSDRQIPLDDFSVHWQLVNDGYDCVFGVRRQRHDPQLRLWLTRFIRYALQAVFNVKIYDANIPYKLFRRTVWNEASKLIPPDTLAPSLFLAIFAKKKNYRVYEIDVPHMERATGEVSIRRLKLLKFCIRGFIQMLSFRQRLRHAG
jgi:glycosyltransferase involved in cell wall biosynthesis